MGFVFVVGCGHANDRANSLLFRKSNDDGTCAYRTVCKTCGMCRTRHIPNPFENIPPWWETHDWRFMRENG